MTLSFTENLFFLCPPVAAESEPQRDGEALQAGLCRRRRRSGGACETSQGQGISSCTELLTFAPSADVTTHTWLSAIQLCVQQ